MNTVFHDGGGSQAAQGWFFEGIIDEVWVVNEAFTADDLGTVRISVEPVEKMVTLWGAIKAGNQ